MSVSIRKSGALAHVIVDNPPVNAISQAVRQALLDAVATVERDPEVRAVILSGAGRTFVAGADVREFDGPSLDPSLPAVVAGIEACSKPWAAAIHGAAFGGGLELALGCRWRLALPDAQLGLPEVNLGIIPGAGGTVRGPRLIGVEATVTLATGGKPMRAKAALEIGLIDALLTGDLLTEAEAWVLAALERPLPQRLCDRPVAAPAPGFWDSVAPGIRKAAKGNPAPEEALTAIRRATEHPFAEAMAGEREATMRLRRQPHAAALRHMFFAERGAPRPAALKGVTPRPITSVGVIGGGTMGAGIAVALLDAGVPVQMIERDADAVARGRGTVEATLRAAVEKRRITPEVAAERIARFKADTEYAALADCSLVIEAVFEDLEVKRAVFARLVEVCGPETVLATNTSYLDPDQIVAGLPGAERFIGLHFFSPANVMKLLEIVPTSATAPEVLATGFELAKRLGKVPVRAGICDGFIGNRLYKLTRMQAERLLLAGATPSQIDAALRGFGFAMGPFETQDLAGHDIAALRRKAERAQGKTPFAPVADRLVALGRIGNKSGGGWYDPGSRDLPAPVATAIAEARAEAGLAQRDFSADEIIEAVVYPMIDEALRIVAEGIADSDADIDLVKVLGYGFPRWRGGPLHYAGQVGLAQVAASLQALADQGLAAAPGEALRARL